MSTKTILVTGGAGFIGSHLCDELLVQGHEVRVLDNLLDQVHGPSASPPAYLNRHVKFFLGDLGDSQVVARACRGVDVVFHLGARVGVGQSMYQIADYTATNNLGTAVLLQELIKNPVEKLIVASSMSIYGEGLYCRPDGAIRTIHQRSFEQLKAGLWEVTDEDGTPLQPIATPETKAPALASIYALSKYDQESMCLITGRAYHIPTVALRFFNTYGARQALSNPYTGVLAIFAARLLNHNPPLIYEDGQQKRDFVHVTDVARACRLAMDTPAADGRIFNVGSGNVYTICELAARMAAVMGKQQLQPEITGKYRVGDIRHCFADISQARQILGYAPLIPLEVGIEQLAEWLAGQTATDKVAYAQVELATHGLTI
ncbi:MAG: NAD-dependent epimerase/dehydratase family protein [Caldilineaceae bacterium]